jgi:hypothetical protein
LEEEGIGELEREGEALCRALVGYRRKVLAAKERDRGVLKAGKWKEIDQELGATVKLVRETMGGAGLGIIVGEEEKEESMLERYSERLMDLMVRKISERPRDDVGDAVGKG